MHVGTDCINRRKEILVEDNNAFSETIGNIIRERSCYSVGNVNVVFTYLGMLVSIGQSLNQECVIKTSKPQPRMCALFQSDRIVSKPLMQAFHFIYDINANM